MINFIKNKIIFFLYWLIKLIENIEYRKLNLDENNINDKIIDTIKLKEDQELLIESDTGIVPVSHIHLTQPYTHYDVILENGYHISAADTHILFDSSLNQVYVKNLKKGDSVYTDEGIQKIFSIKKTSKKTSMGDLTINHPNHRYYTDGFLSHNTIVSSIFMLHTILFNNDKTIMIVANKGDTTLEIIEKIKSIYTHLPFFLKPGVEVWNQKSLTFDNGCRVKTSARTKSPAIGFTIDILYLDEFAHIPSNIIEPYYRAAYPTVTAVENSKIIITSTPNGMNLFHDLLINAEKPPGEGNRYKAKRVYWYEVPGRFVTYIRLNEHKLYKEGIDVNDVLNEVKNQFEKVTEIELVWDNDLEKDVINVYNNEHCHSDDVKKLKIKNGKGYEINIASISDVSTWKEDTIKDIGGEDAFNQEYGLRFINESKSLLNENITKELIENKTPYISREIDILEKKLKFEYKENLFWIDDEDIWNPALKTNYKIFISLDLSEGLGQDYSILNMFRILNKSEEVIGDQITDYKSYSDFFKLEQIGMYRSNVISIEQMAELFYLLVFEYFNPDNVKVVLELNTYGNAFLSELPYVFDGANDFGSFVFLRYKHRLDSEEEKIGLKVGNNKKLLVKKYQENMLNKNISITNDQNIHEVTTFAKKETSAGNIQYEADVGNDDTVMTLVNLSTIFDKVHYKEMVKEYMDNDLNRDIYEFIQDKLNQIEYKENFDYSIMSNIRNKYRNVNQ